MIALLNGVVVEKNDLVIIDCSGVGYGVLVTQYDMSRLSVDQTTRLYIHENIKEDLHDLIGFLDIRDKKLFEQLITVKNVGPKSALAVLDIGASDEVRVAIAGGDVKKLQTAKGVGKRAAEQIIVELRDKVGAPVGDAAESLVSRGGINQSDEALQALITLGYSEADAMNSLQNIDKSLSTEERIKQALKR